MNTQKVIEIASKHLKELPGHLFDVLSLSKPIDIEAAVNLTKIISKLSPLVGNLIEFNTVEFLNRFKEYAEYGRWERQDPGFPDTIFRGSVHPTPGFEIKAWFPLSTEITARFKDSQNHFLENQTYVTMLAWLPEKVIFGKAKIIDIVIVPGASVAKARDDHYHNPPDYLIFEPEDTSSRTRNLQQTNTNGYKFQGSAQQFAEAVALVESWGEGGRIYKPTPEYQRQIRGLLEKYQYRLDTNYAKMDRIVHREIEDFKTRVLTTVYQGITIGEWNRILYRGSIQEITETLEKQLDIKKQ